MSGDDIEALVLAAEALIGLGHPRTALTLLDAAVESDGLRPALLWPMAQAHFALQDHDQGLARVEQATELESSAAEAARRRIGILSGAGQFRKALASVDTMDPALLTDPAVRSTVHKFYAWWQFYAHAVVLGPYKPPKDQGFTPVDRATWYVGGRLLRRWSWLRRRALVWENRHLLEPARQAALPHRIHLEQASGLTGSVLTSAHASLDAAKIELRYRNETWRLATRWFVRLLPCTVLLLWPVLWLLATQLPRTSRPRAIGLPTLASAAIALAIALLVFALARSAYLGSATTLPRITVQAASVVAVGVGGAEIYMNRLAPTAGWQYAVVYGLIAAPAVAACVFAAVGAVDDLMWRSWRDTARYVAQFDILDDLLLVLHYLRNPGPRSTSARLAEAQSLDWIASRMSDFLLVRKQRFGLSQQAWLNGRAQGWAQAVRHLQRGLVSANPGQRDKIERTLCQQIRCLATGDLGALPWRPPLENPRPAGIKGRILSRARDLLVALLPLGAVAGAQPFLHLSTDPFRWALITTGVWAVLSLMNTLDPALGVKLAAAKQLTDTLRSGPGAGPPR